MCIKFKGVCKFFLCLLIFIECALSSAMAKRQLDMLSFRAKVWKREFGKRIKEDNSDCEILAGAINGLEAKTFVAGEARITKVKVEKESSLVSKITEIVDLKQSPLATPNLQVTRGNDINKLRKSANHGRRFQENWCYQFPWCQELERPTEEIAQVQCVVCTKIEGMPKILCAKIDGLGKHAWRKRALFDLPKFHVAKGEYYINTPCQHLKNERLVFSLRQDSVVQQLVVSTNMVRQKKVI